MLRGLAAVVFGMMALLLYGQPVRILAVLFGAYALANGVARPGRDPRLVERRRGPQRVHPAERPVRPGRRDGLGLAGRHPCRTGRRGGCVGARHRCGGRLAGHSPAGAVDRAVGGGGLDRRGRGGVPAVAGRRRGGRGGDRGVLAPRRGPSAHGDPASAAAELSTRGTGRSRPRADGRPSRKRGIQDATCACGWQCAVRTGVACGAPGGEAGDGTVAAQGHGHPAAGKSQCPCCSPAGSHRTARNQPVAAAYAPA